MGGDAFSHDTYEGDGEIYRTQHPEGEKLAPNSLTQVIGAQQ